jgi:hypothetical protein
MPESLIQYKLAELDMPLKCYGLDNFPLNTLDFQKYI